MRNRFLSRNISSDRDIVQFGVPEAKPILLRIAKCSDDPTGCENPTEPHPASRLCHSYVNFNSDEGGKAMIRRVFEAAVSVKDFAPTVYREDYDLKWGQLLCSGVDLWLNVPKTYFLTPQIAAYPNIDITPEGAIWYIPRPQGKVGISVLYPDVDKMTSLAAYR